MIFLEHGVQAKDKHIYSSSWPTIVLSKCVCVFACHCSVKTGYENNENYQLGLTSFSGRLIFPPEILHIPYKICTGGRVFFVFFLVKTTNYYLYRNSSLLQLLPNFTFNLQNLILCCSSVSFPRAGALYSGVIKTCFRM